MSSQEKEKLLRHQIEDYLAEVYQDKHAESPAYEITEIIKKFLEQRKQHYHEKDWSYHLACSDRLFDELINDLEI